jgi:hypothetical protein
VLDWRSKMYEDVEAGEIAPKTVNNSRVALLGCCNLAVLFRHMASNPVKDVRPLKVERREPLYLRTAQIMDYFDACSSAYRPLARS